MKIILETEDKRSITLERLEDYSIDEFMREVVKPLLVFIGFGDGSIGEILREDES